MLPLLATLFPMIGSHAQSALAIRREGTTTALTWNSGGFLQSAANPTGPWTTVPNASSPFRVTPSQGQQYYRIHPGYSLTVSKTGAGAGSVVSLPAGIECGSFCQASFPPDTRVTLQATPQASSTFEGWSGACTGTGPCEVVLNRNLAIGAAFAVAPPPTSLVNGNFEQGPGVGWQQQPGDLILPANEIGANAYGGNWAARLGFHPDGRRLARIGQRARLPNRQPLYVNFAAWVYSEELCDVPYYDNISIYVNGQPVYQDDRVCRGSDTGGWLRTSIDVTPLAGQEFTLVFEISSADSLSSIVLLDEIAVSETPWAQ